VSAPPANPRRRSGNTSRDKGAEFEREVVSILRAAGWPLAERTSNGRVQSARGDIAGGPPGVHIECKRQERLNVPKTFDQVLRDANPLDIPVMVHRPSRHAIMATLPLEELLPLLRSREA
jgi:hypothetical protein